MSLRWSFDELIACGYTVVPVVPTGVSGTFPLESFPRVRSWLPATCVQRPCSVRGCTPKTLGIGHAIRLLSFSRNEVSKLPYSSISTPPACT